MGHVHIAPLPLPAGAGYGPGQGRPGAGAVLSGGPAPGSARPSKWLQRRGEGSQGGQGSRGASLSQGWRAKGYFGKHEPEVSLQNYYQFCVERHGFTIH